MTVVKLFSIGLVSLIFSNTTFGSQETIFGPKIYSAKVSNTTTTSTVLNQSTAAVPGSILIQNGNGNDILFGNCGNMRFFRKVQCFINNASYFLRGIIDRPSSVTVKWNGVEIVNKKIFPWTQGKYLVSVSVLPSNVLVVSRQGANGSTVTVTVKAESINQNQLPMASFSSTPNSGIAPELLFFNGMLSSDADGQIVSYSWDFGDGGMGSGSMVSHQYVEAGNYSVKLTVTDDRSGQSSYQQSISILENSAPIPAFDYIINTQLSNYTYEFNSSQSSDSDGSIVSYEWQFGNLGTSSEPNPSFQFLQLGDYEIILTIMDNKNAISSISKTLSIRDTVSPVISSEALSNSVININRIHISVADDSAVESIVSRNGILLNTFLDKEFDIELTEGVNNLEINSRDLSGNQSQTFILNNITVDAVLPVLDIQVLQNYFIRSESDQIEFDIFTNEQLANLTVDNIPAVKITDYQYKYQFAAGNTGARSFNIVASDLAGNQTTLVALTSIAIDTEPPALAISAPQYTKLNEILVSVNVVDEGETLTEIRLDNVLIDSVSEKNFIYLVSLGSDGVKNLEVRTTDSAGNFKVQSLQIIKDNSPLLVQIVAPQPGGVYSDQVLEVRLISNKDLKTVHINNLLVEIGPDKKSIKYFTQLQSTGMFTISVAATDEFGDSSTVSVSAELKLNSLASWTYEECAAE